MLWPVVEQMAPLVHGSDIAVTPPAMGWVMVEMRCRQHDLGRPDRSILGRGRAGGLAASAVAPGLLLLIPPATVVQSLDDLAVRAAAGLAASFGAHEADPAADLRPVDRVEVLQLGADRHDRSQVVGLAWALRPAARGAGGSTTDEGDSPVARRCRGERRWSGLSSAAAGSAGLNSAAAGLATFARRTKPPSRGSTSSVSPVLVPRARRRGAESFTQPS